MSLRSIVKRELVSCSPDASVKSVAQLMDEKNVGSVVIVEAGRPVGIVTDRDIVTRCVVEGHDCTQMPVRDIMTESVHTISLDEGLYNVIELMKKHEIRRAPIVDDDGMAVGLLSFGDVFELVAKEINLLMVPTKPETPKITERAA